MGLIGPIGRGGVVFFGRIFRGVAVRSGFSVHFRLLYCTFFQKRDSHARWTVRRAGIMLFFLPAFTALQCLHRFCLFLDTVFYPAYRDVVVREPVFMLGIPRSGTTFLHRLVSRDTENFTTMNLWEMLFAPAIIEKRFWLFVGRADRRLGGLGRRGLGWLDERVFRQVRAIHHISLFEPEEDDLLLFPVFSSLFLLFPFPFMDELWHHAQFDDETPEQDRRRIMEYYRACIQRHLYVFGTEKRYLAKNPTFSAKTETLRMYFPDACLVCNVRDPLEAIPSLLSFLSFTWRRFDNDFRGDTFRDVVVALGGYWYRMPMGAVTQWPEDQFEVVLHEELRRVPGEVVERVYGKFGLVLSDSFSEVVAQEEKSARGYVSGHKYSLEKFGLTEEGIETEFSDVINHYDFAARQ